jgi:hypothetical protein
VPRHDQLPAAEYPLLSAMAPVLARHSPDAEFEFGLEVFLRGLQDRLRR